MVAGGYQSRDVGHVHHQQCAAGVGDFPQEIEADFPAVGGRASHDELGANLQRQRLHLVIVDIAGFLVHAVGDEVVQLAGEIDRGSVGQMPAVGQVHPQHCVAGLQQGEIRRLVGLRAGMGLDVGMLRAEQLAGPFPRDVLHHIYFLAAAIIALARIPFGVFIGQDAAHGRHHRGGHDIFRSDQLQIPALTEQLALHGLPDFRIRVFNKTDGIHHICVHVLLSPFLNNIFLYYHLPTGERNPSPRFFPFFSFFIFMHFYANPVFLPIPPV